MKQLLKNSIVICITLVFILSAIIINVSAEENVVTYGIEYTDTTATVTFYMKEISSFDIAVAYDPAKLKVTDCGYSTAFMMLQREGNMTISVMNEDALDEKGNTYMVFTGAGTNQSTGGAIEFAGNPLATVTFEGDLANSVITIVTDSASVDDIYTANKIDEVSLNQSSGVVITPAPIDGVEYKEDIQTEDSGDSKNANADSQNTNSSDTSSSSDNQDDEATDNISENIENPDSAIETEVVEDETDSDADLIEETDISEQEDATQGEEESTPGVMLYVLIGVAVLLVTVAVILVVKKRKSIAK